MELRARRVFRFALVTALAATIGFALQLQFTLLPPVMAILLSLKPAPPMKPGTMLALVLVILLTTSLGLLLVPLLLHYPLTAVLLVMLGLYASSYLTVNLGQGALGAFLATGFVLISSLGLASGELGRLMVQSMAGSVIIAILCQWLVYPLFPEDPQPPSTPPQPETGAERSNWIALRSTLVVLPVWLAALHDPSTWVAALTKALTIGQQRTHEGVRLAGLELMGSTFLGGLLAVLFWLLLGLFPSLWTLFLLALLLGLYGGSKLYGILATRLPATFWSNTLMTAWILLAPAVSDTASGKDVYKAFFVRFSLFVGVTLYAWVAMVLLESWRNRRRRTTKAVTSPTRAAS